jgi:hypothetical protein
MSSSATSKSRQSVSFARAGRFHTDKKENLIFLIYKEIQNGTVAK